MSSSVCSNEEKITRTMGDVIKEYDTEELIDYLQRSNLKLDDDDFAILRKQKITGRNFFKLTEEKLERWGMLGGPITTIVEFIEELTETKLRSFSSYKTLDKLKEVLRKYKVNGEKITCIKQFNPVYEEIGDDDKVLKRCMKEVILRLSNLETIQDSTNEATRCVFITSILNASIAITRKFTNNEKIYIAYQDDVSGEDSFGRVDYSIKGYEDLVCIAEGKPGNVEIGYLQNIKQLESASHMNKRKRTADQAFQNDDDYLYGIVSTATEWHFIKLTTEGLYSTSKSEYRINLSKTALKEDLESIRKGVKTVISIIVGLLKDRIAMCDEHEIKKRRIQKSNK
ncbi:14305_t:CDS:2 [Gigaspora margarita]|uniref:14305_t:CDS:1 n=1 Tax=Gigaspora margarita TaxID=4874 RepID=A0ABN7WU09_GIGMA|nr:14305_t:CDS:2 [Gigaspora margarita]